MLTNVLGSSPIFTTILKGVSATHQPQQAAGFGNFLMESLLKSANDRGSSDEENGLNLISTSCAMKAEPATTMTSCSSPIHTDNSSSPSPSRNSPFSPSSSPVGGKFSCGILYFNILGINLFCLISCRM